MSMIGSRATSRISNIRMFLKADSAEELVRLQLQNNLMLNGEASYTDIQFVDGKWYAWFLVDIDQTEAKTFLEQINGTISDSV